MSTAEPTPPAAPVPTGHPKGFYFLFAGEFAERFSFYGMRAILPLYLADQLGYGEARGGVFYAFFLAMCYFTPLIGGYIADNFFGKYWTIVGFSLPYVAGQFLVGFENTYVLVGALALLCIGTGVIKPNISTLMGMTYDQQRPGQEQLRTTAFQAFYMSINIGAAMSQILVPLIRDLTGSYQIAFMVPAAFMIIALAIFAAGKKYYAVEKIDRNRPPATADETVAKIRVLSQIALLFLLVVFFWAVFDQSSSTWVYFAKTYMNRQVFGYQLAPDSIQALNAIFIVSFIGGGLLYAKYFGSKDPTKKGMPATTRMFLGFVLTAVTMGVMAVAGYLTGEPETVVKVKAGKLEILLPAATETGTDGKPTPVLRADLTGQSPVNFGVGKITAKSGTMPLGDPKLSLAFADVTVTSADAVKFKTGELKLADGKTLYFTGGKIDYAKSADLFAGAKLELAGARDLLYKMGNYPMGDGKRLYVKMGNTISVEADTLAPSKAKDDPYVSVEAGKYLAPDGRVSVWWMALAFFVITIAEVLISVTGLELAFVVAPPTMKSFVTACWLFTVFLANATVNAPLGDLYPDMHPGNYFLLLAGCGAVIALISIPVGRRFNKALRENEEKAAALKAKEGGTEAV